MARGRQQKWICLDCGAAFAVQGIAPKMCCACGSARLGRAPSLELAENFAEKRVELERICRLWSIRFVEDSVRRDHGLLEAAEAAWIYHARRVSTTGRGVHWSAASGK